MKTHTHGGDVYRHTNVIDFSANCNPLGTPQRIKDAISKAADQIVHYPDVHCEALIKALAKYEQVEEEQLICGNGAADLVFSLALACKPKRALLPAPTFAEYEQALETVGCQVNYYQMQEQDGFRIGRQLLEQITEEIDMLFLCNPNNPTGLLVSCSFLEEVLMRCREKHVFLVLDECFVDFVENPEAHTMKPFLHSYENFFILKAFTKRYAMAGVRLGYGLCSNRQLLDQIRCVTQPWNVSTLAQEAGIAALQENAYVEQAMRLVHEENPYLKEKMKEIGLTVYDSQANYIFFKGPCRLKEYCLEQGILIRDCSNYVGLQEGFYRIAVRTRWENDQLLRVLSKAVKELACPSGGRDKA
ncbi:MAG: pyridoxal phosphate-dependent aminotransferase [Lachnospiraceae bacterium]